MRPQIVERPSVVEATYKAREVEGILDLYFYRKIGFWLAQFFARLKVTPAGVTLLGGVCGIIAGHLYYYRDLRVNIAGMENTDRVRLVAQQTVDELFSLMKAPSID